MNTQENMSVSEKSLKLAEIAFQPLASNGEIVGWMDDNGLIYHKNNFDPYATHMKGKAQFAAILLKFPEVMYRTQSFTDLPTCNNWEWVEPTQESILDEILRMNGIDIEAMSGEL